MTVSGSAYAVSRRGLLASLVLVLSLVACSESDDGDPPEDRPETSRSFAVSDRYGPLAIYQGGAGDDGRTEGEVRVSNDCVFLSSSAGDLLLIWPEGSTSWSESDATIEFDNPDGSGLAEIRDGDRLVLSGGGTTIKREWSNWVDSLVWVVKPDPSCESPATWAVSGVSLVRE